MAKPDEAALTSVRTVVARVLEVDPGVLRADTPLADIGCDPVALIAIVDLLSEGATGGAGEAVGGPAPDAIVRGAVTLGDLTPLVGPVVVGPVVLGPVVGT